MEFPVPELLEGEEFDWELVREDGDVCAVRMTFKCPFHGSYRCEISKMVSTDEVWYAKVDVLRMTVKKMVDEVRAMEGGVMS